MRRYHPIYGSVEVLARIMALSKSSNLLHLSYLALPSQHEIIPTAFTRPGSLIINYPQVGQLN